MSRTAQLRRTVVAIALACVFSVPATISAQVPNENEIRWRAFLESGPTVGKLIVSVSRADEPFAGWAFQEVLNRTESDAEERASAMYRVVVFPGGRYRDLAFAVIMRDSRDAFSIGDLARLMGVAPDRSIRDKLANDVFSRSGSDKAKWRDLRYILTLDISVKYKEEAARRLLERDFPASRRFPDHLLTHDLVRIMRDAPEPWKRKAFEHLWEKRWESIVAPLQQQRLKSLRDNLSLDLDDVPEPYRSALKVLQSLPERPQAADVNTILSR